jgi:hypothetical protein
MYQRSQAPTEAPQVSGENTPEFKQAMLSALTPIADDNPNIDYITLEGSILDLHYRQPVSQVRYNDDASFFAMAFSREKESQLGRSDVVVRCIEDNLIRAEVTAQNGQVLSIKEL